LNLCLLGRIHSSNIRTSSHHQRTITISQIHALYKYCSYTLEGDTVASTEPAVGASTRRERFVSMQHDEMRGLRRWYHVQNSRSRLGRDGQSVRCKSYHAMYTLDGRGICVIGRRWEVNSIEDGGEGRQSGLVRAILRLDPSALATSLRLGVGEH